MGYFDITLLVLMSLIVIVSYSNGVYKSLYDLITIYISSVLSLLLVRFIDIYPYFHFFKFENEFIGLKSLNIILWRVIIYFALLFIFLLIFQLIARKTKILNKVDDSMVEVSPLSHILGTIVTIPLVIILFFNVSFIFNLPFINNELVNDSVVTKTISEKTYVLSNLNKPLYNSEKYIKRLFNNNSLGGKNNKDIENKIINKLRQEKILSSKTYKKLVKQGKLLNKNDYKGIIDSLIDKYDKEHKGEEND